MSLHEFTREDAPFILELLNEPSFLRFVGDKKVRTLDDARGYLEDGPLASYREHGFGLYLVALEPSRVPIGMCGVLKRADLDHPDIGFAFLSAYWRKGYALEAAEAVMVHAREELGLGRVLAITDPENEPSARLLEKIGFSQEGRISLGEDDEVVLYVSPGN